MRVVSAVLCVWWAMFSGSAVVMAVDQDKDDSCPKWAASGECDKNPGTVTETSKRLIMALTTTGVDGLGRFI